ncbi:peptidoglycan D,D-transpeptidase FtsI family protein [Fusicatenibacter saccharivorans]|uniref:peptidoglycan D,D-transpeptidase FtsI family protein n=1 Tax=Lachnospiraceae TaxID=186803 RepID=UPI002A315A0F|nr:penicillin-binding transpeptidase domain-containing protein [bacterium]MDD7142737.1 penicillin-binding transpeptidase domain-containing protein [bacterium]MDY5456302.1 penicillin-binding transpeptidase domain-containing protein [Bariatricus sp.]
MRNKTYNKKKMLVVFLAAAVMILGLLGRLVYLMIFDAEYYQEKAKALHEREREIKAARGEIVDRNGVVLATNRTVCTISVIHSQIKEPERVIEVLSKELGISSGEIRKKAEKISSREKIKTNVDKETGDRIREYDLDGVKIDEDFKRYYPYDSLASKVIGFTGGDNQGIIGLEVKYEKWLKGTNGTILTTTDARGIELEGIAEDRIEPVAGETLQISLDYNIQMYAQQAALKVMEEKEADAVVILVMNPQNGEIYACVNIPEFNLNDPFTLNMEEDTSELDDEVKQERLNQMWRNRCINDTYEPGSVFKVFTASAALEEGVVSLTDQFYCPGYKIVEDRKIRCARTTGHGAETFVQGVQNSCNPVFIEVGLRLGVDNFYKYFEKFGLLEKTGVDLPGEADTIMHKKENVGQVELATMSFGQSFQVTPIQMAATISSLINGGERITPHFGMATYRADGEKTETFDYGEGKRILSQEVSETMQAVLETVVSEGGGKNAYIEGYRIGGKTATSQTLPRSARKYIASFVGFAPADDPEVLAMAVIYNPQGVYYGGTIAAPVVRDIFDNVLPYLGIEKQS